MFQERYSMHQQRIRLIHLKYCVLPKRSPFITANAFLYSGTHTLMANWDQRCKTILERRANLEQQGFYSSIIVALGLDSKERPWKRMRSFARRGCETRSCATFAPIQRNLNSPTENCSL